MPTTTLMAPSFWWSTPGVLAYLRPASADAPSPVLPSDPNLRFRRRARADALVQRSEPDAFPSVSPQRSPHLDLHKTLYQRSSLSMFSCRVPGLFGADRSYR